MNDGNSSFILLYGPPGSGKSTLARALARALALPAIDLDAEIERQSGQRIPEIFAGAGESAFRQLEKQALQQALAGPPAVIALGGGALLDAQNRRAAEAAGAVLCLYAPLEVLRQRLQASPTPRPLLQPFPSEASPILTQSAIDSSASHPVEPPSVPVRLSGASAKLSESVDDPSVPVRLSALKSVDDSSASVRLSGASAKLSESIEDPSVPVRLSALKSVDDSSVDRLSTLLEQRREHYASFPLQLNTARGTASQLAWQAQVLLGRFHVRGMGQGLNTSGYDVLVQPGGLAYLGAHLRQRGLHGPVALVADDHVASIYAPAALAALHAAGYAAGLVTFPAGEAHKTLETVASLWQGCLALGLERRSTLVALGGGVTGDLAGFTAATYLRGFQWVAAPTTLLAMADASLGGKTGFDLPQGKNLVGAFYPPRLVLADPQTLSSLPERELRSGLAEVVKAGIIADPALFALCAQGWQVVSARLEEVVRRSMAVKVRVVQADPYERGRRAALNLGHTIGHAVETASNYHLLHGEAIAIGMVAEARLAENLGLARPGLARRIATCLEGLGLPTVIPSELSRSAILQAATVDKKRAAGSLRFALPQSIGRVRVSLAVPEWEEII